MTTWAQKELDKLRAKYGDTWEIWVVPRVVGGPLFCARPHHDHKHVLNEDTPEGLEHAITQAEAGG